MIRTIQSECVLSIHEILLSLDWRLYLLNEVKSVLIYIFKGLSVLMSF